jgi:hypothetical protein
VVGHRPKRQRGRSAEPSRWLRASTACGRTERPRWRLGL